MVAVRGNPNLTLANLRMDGTAFRLWARMSHLASVAIGGIGFTVSLFITQLAYQDPTVIDAAKLGVFAGSIIRCLNRRPHPDLDRPRTAQPCRVSSRDAGSGTL